MRAGHLVPAVLAALLISGCGATSFAETVAHGGPARSALSAEPAHDLPTPEQLAHDTVAALRQVHAVSIRELRFGQGSVTGADLRIDGANVAGGAGGLQNAFEVVVVNGAAYVRGEAEFWTRSGLDPQVADSVAWRWVAVPDTVVARRILPLSLSQAVQDLAGIVSDTAGATVQQGRLAGRPVYILTLADGGGVHIAAEGPAYPLQAATAQGFNMDFDGFDEPQRITAPRDPLDLSRLGG